MIRLHACSWTFQTHNCEHSPLTGRAAAAAEQDSAVPMATWALTTWPPIGLAQPLLAACCSAPRAQGIECHRNAQQQLLALEQTLGTLVPQAAYCGILELFWTFPAYQAPVRALSAVITTVSLTDRDN